MKNILIILLLAFSAGIAQDKPLFTKVLKIKYTFGHKSQTVKEMTFFLENNMIYGRITIPSTDANISARTKINEASITKLQSFVKLARKYQNGCKTQHVSSDDHSYVVTIDNENIKIRQSCDWKSFNYGDLEKQIFGNYRKSIK